MRILVTGGTGLLGNNILRQLDTNRYQLLALIRGKPHNEVFQGIDCQFVSADVVQQQAIDAAVSQSDAVIHSAGLIQLGWSRLAESMQVNRDGTRYLVDACLKHQKPLVHVGTVNTVAVGCKTGPSNEETPLEHQGGQIPCSYVTSKRAGVDEVLKGVKQGLDAAIVHPGFMLGPWDWKPSSGRMMLEVGKRWQPLAPTGGCSVCDARDVAAGTIAALQAIVNHRIPSGRQFILAGENLTYMQLWREFARRMGRMGPVIPAGPLMRVVGGWFGDAMSAVRKQELDLNSAAVRMSSQYHWYDSSRARRELDYRNRPLEQTFAAATDWLKSKFMPGTKELEKNSILPSSLDNGSVPTSCPPD